MSIPPPPPPPPLLLGDGEGEAAASAAAAVGGGGVMRGRRKLLSDRQLAGYFRRRCHKKGGKVGVLEETRRISSLSMLCLICVNERNSNKPQPTAGRPSTVHRRTTTTPYIDKASTPSSSSPIRRSCHPAATTIMSSTAPKKKTPIAVLEAIKKLGASDQGESRMAASASRHPRADVAPPAPPPGPGRPRARRPGLFSPRTPSHCFRARTRHALFRRSPPPRRDRTRPPPATMKPRS